MKDELRNKLKLKQIEFVIQSELYSDSLKEVTDDIYNESKKAENEASIVSIFDLELFGFIKDTFGLKYKPEKEVKIGTIRHVSKGRIDSKIGALVIEFKHTSKLKTVEHKTIASNQLIDYLNGLNQKNNQDYIVSIRPSAYCRSANLPLTLSKLNTKEEV